MKPLKYTSKSGIIVSTIKIPYIKGYETMIFDSNDNEIFCRRYNNKESAIKYHEYYI